MNMSIRENIQQVRENIAAAALSAVLSAGAASEAAAVSVVLTIIKVEIIGPHIDPLLKFFVLEVYPFDIAQYTGKI